MAKTKTQPVAAKKATAKKSTKVAAAPVVAAAEEKKIPTATETPETEIPTSESTEAVTEDKGQVEQENQDQEKKGKDQETTNQVFTCVVIPYLHEKAMGEELRYALRAWDKHLPGVKIVVIGDKPEYLSDLVHHIPAVAKGSNPQSDVAIKLMQAIASEHVPENFIFSNDDIYPIADFDMLNVAFPFCAGQLGDKKNATSGYAEKTNITRALLIAQGLPTFDFGTHLPVLYDKKGLAEVLTEHKADETGVLISSLYFNKMLKGTTPEITRGNATGEHVGYVYRDKPNLELLDQVFKTRKFVNHNSAGYAPTLPFLQKTFPDQSRFEK